MTAMLAVLRRELLLEWRGRARSAAMLVFAVNVVAVLYFAAAPGIGAGAPAPGLAAGLLWVAFTFAALTGQGRSFAQELPNDALSALALASVDRGFIFLGKALAAFLLQCLVQAATALAFAAAFNINFLPVFWPFVLVALLGALGLAGIGAWLSALAARTRYREGLLPLLALPLLTPLLVASAGATEALLAGAPLPWPRVQLLLVTTAVFWIFSALSFEAVLDE